MTQPSPQASQLQQSTKSHIRSLSLNDERNIMTFDKFKHNPPKVDRLGWNLDCNNKSPEHQQINVLSQTVKVPEWWAKSNYDDQKMNQSYLKLKEDRKKQDLPHISYDLDGDGYVGARDYFIAKQFDKDQDGKLNTAEKRIALDAVKNGYEKNFIWNADLQGAQRQFRLLQKRGIIKDGEDFSQIGTTYPKFPHSVKNSKTRTTIDDGEQRKQQQISIIEESKPDKLYTGQKALCSPIKAVLNQRMKNSQQEQTSQNKKELSLRYIESPSIQTKTALKALRKDEIVQELKKLEKFVGNYKQAGQRIHERELCKLRLGLKDANIQTLSKLKDQRKKDYLNELEHKYKITKRGIHENELPKFNENSNTRQWWKRTSTMDANADYCNIEIGYSKFENTNNDSSVEMSPSQQIINSSIYKTPLKQMEVTDKISRIDHWKDRDYGNRSVEFKKGYQKKIKFTELKKMFEFKNQDERLFDKLVREGNQSEDYNEDLQQRRQLAQELKYLKTTNQSSIDQTQRYDTDMSIGLKCPLRLKKGKTNMKISEEDIYSQNKRYHNKNVVFKQSPNTTFSQVGNQTLFSRISISPRSNNKSKTQILNDLKKGTTESRSFVQSPEKSFIKDQEKRGIISGVGMLKH